MLRFKVQTLRSLLWLGNLLVAALIVLLMVQIVMNTRGKKKTLDWMPGERILAAVEGAEPTIQRNMRSTAGMDFPRYSNLWELNVTGKEAPKPVEDEGPAEVKPQLKPIAEVISVRMLSWSSDPKYSKARVSYVEDGPVVPAMPASSDPGAAHARAVTGSLPRLLSIGDELRPPYDAPPFSSKVKEIREDGVLFEWGGEDVLLRPPEMEAAASGDVQEMPSALGGRTRRADGDEDDDEGGDDEEDDEDDEGDGDDADVEGERYTVRPAPPESRPLGADGWFIGEEERDRIRDEYEKLLAEVEIKPTFSAKDKQMVLKLDRVPEGSLAAKRGFEVGDVVRRVNGEAISSKYAAIQYFKANPQLRHFRVEIERRGSVVSKVFQVAP